MAKEKMVGFEIRTLNNLIKRYMDAKRPLELDCLTGIHGWALRYFYENREKDVFQRDFEERFSIRRSTATNMLKLMEKNGLINRVSVDYDARLKKIVLTKKAVEINKMIINDIEKCEKKIKNGISDEELGAFFNTLDKMRTNLEV